MPARARKYCSELVITAISPLRGVPEPMTLSGLCESHLRVLRHLSPVQTPTCAPREKPRDVPGGVQTVTTILATEASLQDFSVAKNSPCPLDKVLGPRCSQFTLVLSSARGYFKHHIFSCTTCTSFLKHWWLQLSASKELGFAKGGSWSPNGLRITCLSFAVKAFLLKSCISPGSWSHLKEGPSLEVLLV